MSAAPLAWVADAACAGIDTDLFFPLPGDKYAPEVAKRICQRCPVLPDCADYGRDERFGIWGGETPRERNKRLRTTGDLVPALGSARRLRALTALGYGPGQVAGEALDLGIEVLSAESLRWIRGNAIRTDAARAAAIVKVYAHLVGRGYCEARSALFARRQAAREGWAPPSAWADLDIDDPKAHPPARRLAA